MLIDGASMCTEKEAQVDDELIPTRIWEVVGGKERETSNEGN